eukprot:s348_g10.t1
MYTTAGLMVQLALKNSQRPEDERGFMAMGSAGEDEPIEMAAEDEQQEKDEHPGEDEHPGKEERREKEVILDYDWTKSWVETKWVGYTIFFLKYEAERPVAAPATGVLRIKR